ncbi:nucleotide exchange factor sil1 [Mortierella alpina]|nr:nucleotide exchange factor sil1 [Mortierella alpina]
MARFNSKLALILGLCAAIALAKTAQDAALDDRPKLICNNGSCYPRIFRPTAEFQEVLEGQEIPPGLHVQMDFETHKKFAKLMDPEDVQSKDATNSILVVDTDTPGTFQHSVGSDNGVNTMPPVLNVQADGEQDPAQLEEVSRMNLQTAFDSMPELEQFKDQSWQQKKETVSQTPAGLHDDRKLFAAQFDLVKTSTDQAQVIEALEGLADLAGDMEFGLFLSSGKPLEALVARLQDADSIKIRSRSARVLGVAVQNHVKAQQAAFQSNLHKVLLKRLEIEPETVVLRQLISAYGNLVRGSNGSSGIFQDDDILRLAEVYNKSIDAPFRRKCVYIMSDFADPDFQPVPENDTKKTPGSVEDKTEVKPVEKINLDVGPWCESLQQETEPSTLEEQDDWEIVKKAVGLLHASYPETCILADNKTRDEL